MTSTAGLVRRARQFAALLEKELLQLVRDRAIFLFIVYIFTFNVLVNAAGASVELRQANVLVHDSDRSALSREFVARLRAPYFRVAGPVEDAKSMERALERGTTRMVVDLPPGLGASVENAVAPARVQALVDSSKVISGYLASSYASRVNELMNEELGAERLRGLGVEFSTLPRIENEIRTAYNFAGDDRWPTAISMLFTMMTFACVLLPAAAMVREKEHGTAEQLLVSPLTPLQILMPKVLSMMLVSSIGVAIAVLAVMQPFLDVPCRGSLLLFLALTAVYAFTNAGLGVLVGTFARTSAQVGLLTLLLILPIVQLSGTWTAIESMPPPLRAALTLSPLHHYLVIGNGILLKGVGLEVLWPHAGAMLVIGLVLFGFAVLRFRRQFAGSSA